MEFQELMMAKDFISTGGIDYAKDLLEKAVGPQRATEIINKLTSSLQVRPFGFIRRTDPAHLLNFIQGEHPQTVARILSYLEPKNAALVLGGLEPEVQANVAKRIAEMERTLPETLREVERVLEKNLSTIASEDYAITGGLDRIVEIMGGVASPELAKALKGVEAEVQDKIFRNMSKRASTLLREDMEYMGPVRLKDVEEAQQKIVSVIRKLAEQGEI